jgi:hypothetical protein
MQNFLYTSITKLFFSILRMMGIEYGNGIEKKEDDGLEWIRASLLSLKQEILTWNEVGEIFISKENTLDFTLAMVDALKHIPKPRNLWSVAIKDSRFCQEYASCCSYDINNDTFHFRPSEFLQNQNSSTKLITLLKEKGKNNIVCTILMLYIVQSLCFTSYSP